MKATITIKLTPESRAEMINEFGAKYRLFREDLENLITHIGFNGLPPTHVRIHWLLNSGRWDAAGPDDNGPR